MTKKSKYLIGFSGIGLLFLAFIPFCLAQDQSKLPNNMDDAKGVLERVLEGIPRIIKETFNYFKHLYYKYMYSWLKAVWDRIYYYLGREVEKRKPEAQKEFNKEVEELKEEVIRETPSLWQRFKNLIY